MNGLVLSVRDMLVEAGVTPQLMYGTVLNEGLKATKVVDVGNGVKEREADHRVRHLYLETAMNAMGHLKPADVNVNFNMMPEERARVVDRVRGLLNAGRIENKVEAAEVVVDASP